MSRRHISTTERVRIFAAAGGVCHLCGVDIRHGEAWEVEHVIPLAMGGDDHGDNLQPAHVACHRAKTNGDLGALAKAKRVEARHIGAKAPSKTPLPGGKRSPWKRLMSGRIIRRDGH